MGFMDGYNMTAGNRQLRLAEQNQSFNQNMALAQFSEQQQERIKKETDAGKAAEYFFKANPEGLTAIGETPESFKNKSAGDRYGAMVAYGQAMMERQRAQQAKAQADAIAGMQRFQQSYSNAATPMNIPAGTFGPMYGGEQVGGPLSANAVADLYLRSGAPLQQMDDVMRGMQYATKAGAQDFMPVPFNVNGMEGVVSPRTGSINLKAAAGSNRVEDRIRMMSIDDAQKRRRVLMQNQKGWPKNSEQYQQAQAEIDAINQELGGEKAEPEVAAEEVIRLTGDGKRAVFDAKTKKFLRYAD